MTQSDADKQVMARYLLGRMSEEERVQFEGQYHADPALCEQLIDVEDEMVRAYLRGDCSQAEKLEFEGRYLSTPQGREKIAFEQSLVDHLESMRASEVSIRAAAKTDRPQLSDATSRQPASWAWGFAAACLALVSFSLWTVVTNMRLSHELAQLQNEQANLRDQADTLSRLVADLNAKLQQSGGSNNGEMAHVQLPPPGIAPTVLTSHLERHTGGEQKVVVQHGAASAPLLLELDRDEFSKYSVVLETADEQQLWKQEGLKSQADGPGKHAVSLELASKFVGNGSYVLRLSGAGSTGAEEVAAYIFRVVKK